MFRSTSGTTLGAAKPLSSVESAELRRRYTQIWLAAGMLISGAANTLTCKQAFLTVSSGHVFNHPFVQAGAMFLGEVCCLIFYLGSMRWRGKRVRWPPRHVLLGFAIPAWCDIIGTSTMYMGLTMTSASTYQMLRGSVVIFTGLMSRVMLRRATAVHQWLGMTFVFSGALVVGSCSLQSAEAPKGDGSAPSSFSTVLLGDLLVVFSQLFTALQMVLEERFVTGHSMPALLAVGCEGVWGLTGLAGLLVVLQYGPSGPSGLPIEDSLDAFDQIRHSWPLLALLLCNALSIAFFNGFGMTITKTSSASYRVVLDSLRTGVVWLFGMATGSEKFHLLQVFGFLIMITGTTTYNETVRMPCITYPDAAERAAAEEKRAAAASRIQPLLPFDAEASPSSSGPKWYNADHFFQLSPKLTRMTIQPK
uniref:EamA domain-containing protein n=1 Tax=Phaeocystis antarctica TaxID=33657 RepID=A0A7S0I4M8_9EUKA|mmetsp:Transcript_7382/g.17318  ORF Transcript_7382/g.17318 Transcript_7382/m.17318 type:complete len:420 (+) Transcript_7382:51-1310(+)